MSRVCHNDVSVDVLYSTADTVVCVASKGLTSAVLNTSKTFEEIGDLYAKQVNIVMLTALFIVPYIFCSIQYRVTVITFDEFILIIL